MILLDGYSNYLSKAKNNNPSKVRNIYHYLLRNIRIERPNQIWQTDISYIQIFKRFIYLAAIKSREIINWSISNSITAYWCV